LGEIKIFFDFGIFAKNYLHPGVDVDLEGIELGYRGSEKVKGEFRMGGEFFGKSAENTCFRGVGVYK
jgi:hypothetical protein